MQKSIDAFKSQSTNTFMFNDDDHHKLDADWDKPELLKFPNLVPQLKKERKVHRELYKEITEKLESRRYTDTSQQLKRYDVEINLQQMLYKNEKYLGLCRNKRKIPNIFGNAIMNRLKNNGKFNANELAFEDQGVHSCRRFEQYSKRYEERCLKEIFEPNLKSNRKLAKLYEDDDDKNNYNNHSHNVKPIINTSVNKFLSASVNDFSISAAQQRQSTMIEPNVKPTTTTVENVVKSFASASMTMLRPKQQIAQASMKKKAVLPAISKQKNENYDFDDDNDDELDTIFGD
jgi:hypothetical protein